MNPRRLHHLKLLHLVSGFAVVKAEDPGASGPHQLHASVTPVSSAHSLAQGLTARSVQGGAPVSREREEKPTWANTKSPRHSSELVWC